MPGFGKRGDLDSEGRFQTESDCHLARDSLRGRLELERGVLSPLPYGECTHLAYAAEAGIEIRDLHQIGHRSPERGRIVVGALTGVGDRGQSSLAVHRVVMPQRPPGTVQLAIG